MVSHLSTDDSSLLNFSDLAGSNSFTRNILCFMIQIDFVMSSNMMKLSFLLFSLFLYEKMEQSFKRIWLLTFIIISLLRLLGSSHFYYLLTSTFKKVFALKKIHHLYCSRKNFKSLFSAGIVLAVGVSNLYISSNGNDSCHSGGASSPGNIKGRANHSHPLFASSLVSSRRDHPFPLSPQRVHKPL